ncbi:hypothetical protein CSUI_010941 [Cystoisospora suis]|uniref:Uncharacterized protein n=1 Tax=Cystoisospora suis TaxID=483139 RepID=A0A2C6KFI2_9APIC|nr:hypothetical protein CSUI_010941 [Cystoisospora suis]
MRAATSRSPAQDPKQIAPHIWGEAEDSTSGCQLKASGRVSPRAQTRSMATTRRPVAALAPAVTPRASDVGAGGDSVIEPVRSSLGTVIRTVQTLSGVAIDAGDTAPGLLPGRSASLSPEGGATGTEELGGWGRLADGGSHV